MKLWLVLFLFYVGESNAIAKSAAPVPNRNRIELLFGPEEEFRNRVIRRSARKKVLKASIMELYSQNEIEKEISKFMKHLDHLCKTEWSSTLNCEIKKNELHFIAQNGEHKIMGFKYDPGVMEIITTPFKVKELDGDWGSLFTKVYDSLKNNTWKIAGLGGEGHVHVDLRSAFETSNDQWDLRRFRNFLVDWIDHNEHYWGILHYDPKAGGANPHFSDPKSPKKFREILSDLDRRIENHGNIVSEAQFREAYKFVETDGARIFGKGRALALRTNTFESRSLKPKQGVSEMKQIYRLLESRMNHIASHEELITYYGGTAPKNVQEAIDRFYLYVTQSGEDWEEAKNLLPPPWKRYSPNTNISQAQLYKNESYTPSKTLQCMAWVFNHLFRSK